VNLMQQAQALRAEQRMIEAERLVAQARVAAPEDRMIAFLHAQSRYELGYPAAELFGAVCEAWPENFDAQRNYALALASEGQAAAAAQRLEAVLAAAPAWVEGHRVLAALRWVGGEAEGYDASYAQAVARFPMSEPLWLGWFSAVAQQRDWARAAGILAQATQHLGETKGVIQARLFLAGESGDAALAERLLAATAELQDDFLTIARIRQALRAGDPARAVALALPVAEAGGAAAGQVWPYLSTCWRLLGDDRAAWLDGDPLFVRQVDVGLSAAELAELADLLRQLHTAQMPYAEQSVRGGTQTDRNLLLRHEPILQRARVALMAAMADFVASLPPRDPRHPLLGRARKDLRISGSWSVRLAGGGHNVTHSHPKGWISSAFYVALPEGETPPAGHLHLGAPPLELGVDLPPYAVLAPKLGQLVMFPSTLWHGTIPTQQGANEGSERLNIAFDVVPADG